MDWEEKLKKKAIENGKEFMEEKGKEVVEKLKDKVTDKEGQVAETKSDAEVKEGEKVQEPAPEKKKLTPEEIRAASAMVMQISLFADGQLEVKSVKNITSRAMAEYLISRAKDDYFKADVANLCAVRLIDLIQQSNKNKKKTGGLWTPGGNK